MSMAVKWGTMIWLCLSSVFAGENGNCTWHQSKKSEKSSLEAYEIKTGRKKVNYEKKFPQISRLELERVVHSKSAVLIDANSVKTYSAGHIPGALSFAKSGDSLAEFLPENKQALIVAYCGGPGCEAWCKAADELNNLGYENVKYFKGGIKEWKAAGLKLEKGGGKKKS